MFNNKDSTVFKRNYVPQADGLALVSIGGITVTVVDDPFWRRFAQQWEPDTERIYQSVIKPDAVVLDIGAWIGPTLLFALACGAQEIYAVEPNPDSFQKLSRLIRLNPQLADRVTLINSAISAHSGSVTMGLAAGDEDTSMFGICRQGHNQRTQEVAATTLDGLINDHGLDQINLIKIDIEGAEAMLCNDLEILSRRQQLCIHLSVHVPFFASNADKPAFADSLKNFLIYDDRGEKLQHQQLKQRLLCEAIHPPWGTRHGNFFELLLLTNE